MREAYLKADPSRIEPMLELHGNIVKAIEDRNSNLAIHWVEEHFDVNIRQHYFDNENL
jgi:DNA-binding GntR family transcriptional regulator